MRYAARTDDNQKEIVEAFRKLGYSVAITSRLGSGFPDLVVGRADRNFLVEVKDSSKPPSARQLTEDEEKFAASWLGQYSIISSVSDVMKFNADHSWAVK